MSTDDIRFQDQNLRLSDFNNEVIVECPECTRKATATISSDAEYASLLCNCCGYNKRASNSQTVGNSKVQIGLAAHQFFGAKLWLIAPFKGDVFFAYNYTHLEYLESYIVSKLREHKDRTHFTLLEKLPKFYHEGKNREALLKIIEKLKRK